MPPTYSDYKLLKTDSDTIPKLLKLGYIPHGSPIINAQNASFQAFVLPVEKPSESNHLPEEVCPKNANELIEMIRLIEKIKSANNGYLFNPSESEITLAQKYPTVFYYRFDSHKTTFPHRITLK